MKTQAASRDNARQRLLRDSLSARDNYICQIYQDGHNVSELSRWFRASRHTILRILAGRDADKLERPHLPRGADSLNLPGERIPSPSHYARCACGAYCAVHARRIQHICKPGDPQPVKNLAKKKPERDAELRQLSSQGWTVPQIAEHFAITETRVRQILEKLSA